MSVIIIVSECIYNQFCKPGCRVREDKVLEEVKMCLANYPCILILKCIEEEIFGIFRFNVTRKMLEKNKFFTKKCEDLAKEIADRVESYCDAFKIKGEEEISKVIIIGVEGSPTCGISRYLDSMNGKPDYGRPKTEKSKKWRTSPEGCGILIESLKKELERRKINFETIGVGNPEETREKLTLLKDEYGSQCASHKNKE